MAQNSQAQTDYVVREGRSLLRPDFAITDFDGRAPSAFAKPIKVAHIASIEARSVGERIGDSSIVIVDKVHARWIYAVHKLCDPAHRKSTMVYTLNHYLALRLVGHGLNNEARAFSERLRLETRLLKPGDGVDVSDAYAETAEIERFILGHELGHVAYRAGGSAIQTLLRTTQDCAADLTRLLRVTFTHDRSLLTPSEQESRYEDIVASMTDYLNRYIYHEYAEDIVKYERDLHERGDYKTLMARRNRYERFAGIFGSVDFLEECFCDLYALEFLLLEAEGSQARARHAAKSALRYLHAGFVLSALDSLARDRLVAARSNNEKRSMLTSVDLTALSDVEASALYEQMTTAEASRDNDHALLLYQVTMLKAIYRRVVFMNYVARHPLLENAEFLRELETEGENLETALIGACATLRFNGIRLEFDHQQGCRDDLEPPIREDLDRLWEDLVVRVPGMAQLHQDLKRSRPEEATPRSKQLTRCCDFCGFDSTTERLMITSGRATICDQCALHAQSSFATMPADRPRRRAVGGIIAALPPIEQTRKADPTLPYCRFCEVAPASGEPLVSPHAGVMICALCAQGAADTVRSRSRGSDPAYFESALKTIENLSELARGSDKPEFRDLEAVADNMRAEYERELHPKLPGPEIWRLFVEPTLPPQIPHRF